MGGWSSKLFCTLMAHLPLSLLDTAPQRKSRHVKQLESIPTDSFKISYKRSIFLMRGANAVSATNRSWPQDIRIAIPMVERIITQNPEILIEE